MKKSSFITMILGTISGMLFSIGMCMALIPEWGAMKPGIIFGCLGFVLGLITVATWRKMTNKNPLQISGKSIGGILLGIVGALLLGVGICFCLVWEKIMVGIVIGMLGIILLLCLIPLIRGIKD